MLLNGNILNKFKTVDSYWSPKVIAEVNSDFIKIAKLKGSLVWHSHKQDEMFIIVKGKLIIELESENITLEEGCFYVVPKGIRHNPVAEEECWVMLIEPKDTLHTGDVMTDKTKSIEQQLK